MTSRGCGAYWQKVKYLFDLGYKQPIGNVMVEFKAHKNYEDRDKRIIRQDGLTVNIMKVVGD
ncbi:MAG: hypothetical protein SNJ53_07470 [Thermodesulfovibrionales bacterium]